MEIKLSQNFKEPEFEPPHNSKWIVAIDEKGSVSVLVAPNIHPGFFENGREAEMVGLPCDVVGTDPGVYEWICRFEEIRDRESGIIEDIEFIPEKSTPLWTYSDEN